VIIAAPLRCIFIFIYFEFLRIGQERIRALFVTKFDEFFDACNSCTCKRTRKCFFLPEITGSLED